MINILISIVFSVLSYCLFNTTICVTGINRAMIHMPIQLIENSVVIEEYEDSNREIYINKEKLETDVTSYIDASIQKFTNDYDLSFVYLNLINHSYCVIDKCRAVKISLSASFMFDYSFHRTMYYEIGGGE